MVKSLHTLIYFYLFFANVQFKKTTLFLSIFARIIFLFFWRASLCWPLLCSCRPFCIFESCLVSNPESCRSKQARYQPEPPIFHYQRTVSHPSHLAVPTVPYGIFPSCHLKVPWPPIFHYQLTGCHPSCSTDRTLWYFSLLPLISTVRYRYRYRHCTLYDILFSLFQLDEAAKLCGLCG